MNREDARIDNRKVLTRSYGIRDATEGAQVFMAGRRIQALEEAVAEVGRQAIGIACDIANRQDLDALFAEVQRRAGHIDVLFANAGGGVSLIPHHA